MTVRVLSGPSHACERDGHVVALRIRPDFDGVKLTPFCEVCRLIFLPSPRMSGWPAMWLLEQIEWARTATEAPPEAYEGMFP